MKKDMNDQCTMIDLFAGCGGLSLGFEMAGFTPLLFSEINLNAAQTFMINRKKYDVIPIGDIYSLTNNNLKLLVENWKIKGIDDIDLVCGGPPCQGYSGIGHRRTFKLEKQDIPSNQLFQEMVRIVKFIRPKVFLFENVKGLLFGKWTKNGNKGEIFQDVLDAFRGIEGYYCEWDLIHAKNYGVPQNRPRVLIIGYRTDVWQKYKQPELNFIKEEPSPYASGGNAVTKGFLPLGEANAPSLREVLGDLVDSRYKEFGATKKYPSEPKSEIQKWLRTNLDGTIAKKGDPITEQEYSSHSDKIEEKFSYMINSGGVIPEHMKTKKFAQRVFPAAWDDDGPCITATSLPDDFVHYCQPRIPTVREWARIQTFPDWYQFFGPRTTGGRRRAGDPEAGLWEREVPKYTQIGNAVPVLLANRVALHIKKILDSNK